MFPLPDLPDDILQRIIMLVAVQSVIYLRPFVLAGKRSYKLVHTHEVLQTCELHGVCDYGDEIRPETRFRGFFEKCLGSRNPTAVYYESLRLATEGADVAGAVHLLKHNAPFHEGSVLALGIFHVCLGDPATASHYFQMYAVHHAPLNSQHISQTCGRLNRALRWFRPSGICDRFQYPDDDVVQWPGCVIECISYEEPFCNECILFRTARNIYGFL